MSDNSCIDKNYAVDVSKIHEIINLLQEIGVKNGYKWLTNNTPTFYPGSIAYFLIHPNKGVFGWTATLNNDWLEQNNFALVSVEEFILQMKKKGNKTIQIAGHTLEFIDGTIKLDCGTIIDNKTIEQIYRYYVDAYNKSKNK